VGASIGDNLECDKGSFTNANSVALSAEGAKIGGAVLLRNGFDATGEVRLFGASIGGNLDCERGNFTNGNGIALNATLAKLESSVFLG